MHEVFYFMLFLISVQLQGHLALESCLF